MVMASGDCKKCEGRSHLMKALIPCMRHKKLAQQCLDLDKPAASWAANELRTLKKRRLREKDKINKLIELMRRQQRQTEEANIWQIGSGHYGGRWLGAGLGVGHSKGDGLSFNFLSSSLSYRFGPQVRCLLERALPY